MLDLSPEKLMMLLTVGLIVLGPNKLPGAARGLAHGLARARHLASTLTDPITATVVEPFKAAVAEPMTAHLTSPKQAIDDAVAHLRSTIANHPIPEPPARPPAPADPALN